MIEGSTPSVYINSLKETIKIGDDDNRSLEIINPEKFFNFLENKKISIKEEEKKKKENKEKLDKIKEEKEEVEEEICTSSKKCDEDDKKDKKDEKGILLDKDDGVKEMTEKIAKVMSEDKKNNNNNFNNDTTEQSLINATDNEKSYDANELIQAFREVQFKTDLKGDLNLGQFRENPVDYDVIKKCRRQAFFNKKIGK